MTNPKLIHIVEDDASIANLLKIALTQAGYSVTVFSNGETMLDECKNKIPDLILLDIMIEGDLDGIEVLKSFRKTYGLNDTAIIMVSAKMQEADKVRGLELGADDYITKPFSVAELLARVKANLRKNQKAKKTDNLKIGALELQLEKRKFFLEGNDIKLTQKEFELLKMLAENAPAVVEREALLKTVWGYDYIGESRTVDIHIKNLKSKLGNFKDSILSERGIGYKLVKP